MPPHLFLFFLFRAVVRTVLVAPLVLLCLQLSLAQDWPQHLGPTRNGIYAGKDLAPTWPQAGPKRLWKKSIGQGYASPVVARGRLVLFHRVGGNEVLDGLDARSGKRIWSFAYPSSYRDSFNFDDGPRSTPTIDSGRIFSYGAEGVLTCLAFDSGTKLWQVKTHEMFEVRESFFGACCSPLVVDGSVLVNVGSRDEAGIVAFDARTGKVLWKSTSDESSYSSPTLATIERRRHAIFFTRTGLVDLDPTDGKVRFSYRWRPVINASVNAATPIVAGNRVFLSTSYGRGAIAFRVQGDKYEKLWSGDGVLSNHYSTCVEREGFLYGFDGRQEYGGNLRCVELETGKVRWSRDRFGYGSVILAGDRLLITTDKGELVLAKVSPAGFESVARAKLFDTTVRAHAALADGLYYARSTPTKDSGSADHTLICLDLRK